MSQTRILVVDDEPLNLAIIEEYLCEEPSYVLDTAAEGKVPGRREAARQDTIWSFSIA